MVERTLCRKGGAEFAFEGEEGDDRKDGEEGAEEGDLPDRGSSPTALMQDDIPTKTATDTILSMMPVSVECPLG